MDPPANKPGLIPALQNPSNNNQNASPSSFLIKTTSNKTISVEYEETKLPVKIIGPDEQEVLPEEIVVPPDGGYGYVIVFVAFMSNIIADGIIFSYGSLKESIQEARKKTGATPEELASFTWVGSVLAGVSLMAAPFASAAANKFGFRIVAVSGSLLASSAFILSWHYSQSEPNLGLLILLYGLVGGIGLSGIYVPAVVSVGFYFEKKRAVATGMAVCGSGVGSCIFPPLVTYLTSKFGWQGAVLGTGIILLLCGALGLLYKPLKPQKVMKTRSQNCDCNAEATAAEIKKEDYDLLTNATCDGDGNFNVKSYVLYNGVTAGRKVFNPSMQTVHTLSNTPSGLRVSQKKMTSVPTMLAGSNDECSTQHPVLMNKVVSSKAKSVVGSPTELSEISEERNSEESIEKEISEKQDIIASKDQSSNDQKLVKGSNVNQSVKQNTRNSSLLVTSVAGARRIGSAATSCRVGNSVMIVDDTNNSKIIRLVSKATLNKPLYRDDIFFGGSLLRIPDYANNPEITSLEWSAAVASPPVNEEAKEEYDEILEEVGLNWCSCGVIKKMLDFSLLQSPTFIVLAVSGMFIMLGLYIPFVFLVDHAYYVLTENPTSTLVGKSNLTFLISIIGAANFLGRIISGWVADRPFVNALIVNNIAVTIMGISTLLVPLLREYHHFMAYSCVFGISMACWASLRSILLVDLLGLGRLTNAFGLLLLFQGMASMVATPLAGIIAEFGSSGGGGSGDQAFAFYAAGGFLLSSAFMCYPLSKVNQWEKASINLKSQE